jgi:peroxiredoxin
MKWLSTLVGGRRKMPALIHGTKAPDFALDAIDGSRFSLADSLTRGPVLAVFFKVSCPVCQYAFPYFERVYKSFRSQKLAIVGISQNPKSDTLDFIRKYAVTFPVLLDDTKSFPVSNAYGLTNVPTAFWISEEGEVDISSVGWVRQDFEEIARRAASASGVSPMPLIRSTEQVVDFRAG